MSSPKRCCVLSERSWSHLTTASLLIELLSELNLEPHRSSSEGREFLASTQEHEFDVLASTQDIVRRAMYWTDACLADI